MQLRQLVLRLFVYFHWNEQNSIATRGPWNEVDPIEHSDSLTSSLRINPSRFLSQFRKLPAFPLVCPKQDNKIWINRSEFDALFLQSVVACTCSNSTELQFFLLWSQVRYNSLLTIFPDRNSSSPVL